MDIRQINSTISVAGQIGADDIPPLKALGFTTIINNRPDGEQPDQPASDEIAAAAFRAGLVYHHIPLGRDGVSPDHVQRMGLALAASHGPALAFCRLGARSVTLWALSQAGMQGTEAIIAAAAHAGYDISHLAQLLDPVQPRPVAQWGISLAGRSPVSASAGPLAMSGANLNPWPEQALSTQPALPMGSTTKRSSSATV